MHSTPNPSRIRFTGPLAPFAPGLVDEFVRLGDPVSTADGYDYADNWNRNPAPTSTSRHNIGIIRRSP